MAIPTLDEVVQRFAKEIGKRGQPAFVLVAAANLDDALGYVLASRMLNLEEKRRGESLNDRIFKHRGPFSDFSAKIDLALALNVYDTAMWKDLHALRDVRNAFAHPQGDTHFDAPHVQALMRRFEEYDGKRDAYEFFVEKAHAISDAFRELIDAAAMLSALVNPQSPQPDGES